MALFAGCRPAPSVPAGGSAVAEGAEVYGMHCAICHLDGAGSPAAPALRGSPVLSGNGGEVARIILEGRRGESLVEGRRFNGIMPAQDYLSNEEIAAVGEYVIREFGGRSVSLTPAEVAEIRARKD